MRMPLIIAYLNAVCDMCASETPEEESMYAKEAEALLAEMTPEEVDCTEDELDSGRWIKRSLDCEGL